MLSHRDPLAAELGPGPGLDDSGTQDALKVEVQTVRRKLPRTTPRLFHDGRRHGDS